MNIAFQSNDENVNSLLETFFKVEPKEHVKAWNWYQFTKYNAQRMDAVNKAAKALAQRGTIEYRSEF